MLKMPTDHHKITDGAVPASIHHHRRLILGVFATCGAIGGALTEVVLGWMEAGIAGVSVERVIGRAAGLGIAIPLAIWLSWRFGRSTGVHSE